MTTDWLAALERAFQRDPVPMAPVVVSPELYDMAVERGYPPESMIKTEPVTMTVEFAPTYFPPGPSYWDELGLSTWLADAVEQYDRTAIDRLLGDLDNWRPVGILAALDHTDTNTTVSMLPDWASQQRPE